MGTEETRGLAETFKALHQGPEILVLPNAWDVASGVVMAAAGFPALATTSAGIAFAQGYRDGEKIGRTQMLEVAGRIAEAVALPVSADLETGFGAEASDVWETIRLATAAGLVGANIEDGALAGEAALIEVGFAAERIQAAREAADAGDVAFVVNARIDCYLRLGAAGPAEKFADTVRRAERYIAAGADCIYVPGVADPKAIGALAAEIDAPLNVLGAFSGTVPASVAELQALGVRRVSIGGSLGLAALRMVEGAVAELRDHGTFGYAGNAFSNAEMNKLMPG